MRRAILMIILSFALVGSVHAADCIEMQTEGIAQAQREQFGTDKLMTALPEEAQDQMRGISPSASTSFGEKVLEIVRSAVSNSGDTVRTAIGTGVIMIAIVLLCSIYPTAKRTANLAGTLAMVGLCMQNVNSMFQMGRSIVTEISEYAKVLMPAMCAATAAAGAPTSSTALYIGTSLFLSFLSGAVTTLLLPMVFLYIAAATADTALDCDMLGKIRNGLKNLIANGLKVTLFVFTAYMTITGVVSGTADKLAVKATKFAISGAIPVVGKIISDASETVVVSAGLLRSSIGVFGMLAVISICIAPFLRMGIQYLILKFTAAICGTVGSGRMPALAEQIASAMGLILSMTGTCCLLLLISAVCFMKVVV